jgi:hypothetical protein
MKARHVKELIAENFPPYVCDICEEIQNEDGFTEGYFLEPETSEETEELQKDFPDKDVILVCENCYAKHYSHAKIVF